MVEGRHCASGWRVSEYALGEGNLSHQSVVNVSQIFTVFPYRFGEYIGQLSPIRVREIPDGLRFLTEPRPHDEKPPA